MADTLKFDVVVIGAGPAGVNAAQVVTDGGLDVCLIDESLRSGGQIYRQQPENFKRSYQQLYGTEHSKAKALHDRFVQLQAKCTLFLGCQIWAIEENTLFANYAGKLQLIEFKQLIICTGATDRILPIEGWEHAGTYTLGAAQIALKAQACSIGREVAFVGSGPLLYLVAAQYAKAGIKVAGVFDTSAWYLRLLALPKLLAQPRVLINGVKLTVDLLMRGIKIRAGIKPIKIENNTDGVTGFTYEVDDKTITVKTDAIALGYHLRPETQLADLAGCEFTFDTTSQQWLVKQTREGLTSVPNVYVAGDGAKILGADAAEIKGKLVGHTVLRNAGISVSAKTVSKLIQKLQKWEIFASGIQTAFPWPKHFVEQMSDSTILCRCECITKHEVKSGVTLSGHPEINRVKAMSRVGMGRCQGRYCADAQATTLAQIANKPLTDIGRLRAQAPIKPTSMRLAGDSVDE
ncbi:BFD-like (2Fe-2S)-binding region [Aequoribacter fuscus]|uniref:BFD-like (2Fe-2S)-binding region n=1 Tax=Aequoribacter fuscus TaxID=2518989 RepID=F3L4X9_9GAMM|nr:NAD(P)/FAD-dependent oxidoreductase [Aequoribacter fuscus]EGG28620.1 BFD-like (2Fe-2S)-binding region [Aequoribacter fuscus]QHJ87378.1 FAD/NAD(P)-binding oxidoreductase [Aequoribacter fuscus]